MADVRDTGRRRGWSAARRFVQARVLTAGVLALAVGAGGLVTACTDDGAPAAKAVDGGERQDVGPLTDRIPALEGVDDATWYSGTLGSRDAPGPSLYWIDAVVTLPSGTADELRDTLDLTTATTAPDVVGELEAALPEDDLLVGEALDDAFSHDGWLTTAYLSADGDALVLVVVGE